MADQENSIKAARERYNQNVERALKRGGERRERFATSSGIEIKRLYGPDDLENFDYLSDLGFPGEYPFTRGVQPTMYRGRLWTMRQYAGFGTAEESNRRYRYLLEQGQTGLSVAFDCRPRWATTPTIRWLAARSDGWESRSARWPTWRPCWRICRWPGFPLR